MKLFRVPRTKAWARANISFREDTNRGGMPRTKAWARANISFREDTNRGGTFRFVKTRTEAEEML